jgi:hypothetical protein
MPMNVVSTFTSKCWLQGVSEEALTRYYGAFAHAFAPYLCIHLSKSPVLRMSCPVPLWSAGAFSFIFSPDISYILHLFAHISLFYNTMSLFRFASASAQHLGTFTIDMRTLIDFSLTTYPLHPIILYQCILWIHLYSLQQQPLHDFLLVLLQALLRKSWEIFMLLLPLHCPL